MLYSAPNLYEHIITIAGILLIFDSLLRFREWFRGNDHINSIVMPAGELLLGFSVLPIIREIPHFSTGSFGIFLLGLFVDRKLLHKNTRNKKDENHVVFNKDRSTIWVEILSGSLLMFMAIFILFSEDININNIVIVSLLAYLGAHNYKSALKK